MPPADTAPPRRFFPTHINTYRQCPERYYHQYIRKRKGVPQFNRPLIVGGATHRLIAAVLPGYMRFGRIDLDLEAQAREEIATSDYPDEELPYREQDALDAIEMTQTALDMLPRDATSLLQERKLAMLLGRSGVEICAQVDLVVQTGDGAIEHIDFKTGKVRDNSVQSLMLRAVVGKRYRAAREIRSTTLYLAHRQRQTQTLDPDASKADWAGIARDIRAIRALDSFRPTPGPLCEYCPFQQRECSVW